MSDSTLGRDPKKEVVDALRKEVNFHCPVPVGDGFCGSPFISWHHFDPPWRIEKHHRVEGMIALCVDHAAQADGGAYTNDQLRRFKEEAYANDGAVKGDLGWLRQDLIVYAGSNMFVDSEIIVAYDGVPHLWFDRNEHGEMLLNYRDPTSNRTYIENNMWVVPPEELASVICPSRGRRLEVRHTNGDLLKLEFKSHDSTASIIKDLPKQRGNEDRLDKLSYPVTILRLTDVTADGRIKIYPTYMQTSGGNLTNMWFKGNGVAISVPASRGTGRRPGHVDMSDIISRAVDDHNSRRN